MASSPKVLFKEFACEHRSKFAEKYPFLTNQQIQAKLKHSWKKTCQENKKTVKLYRSQKKRSLHQKSGEDKTCRRNEKRPDQMTESPHKSSFNSQSVGSPVDSGSWYDDNTTDSFKSDRTTDSEHVLDEVNTDLLRNTRESFTEETVKDVLGYTLKIEENNNSSDSESWNTKSENVVSRLFQPLQPSLQNEEMCRVQRSRLLVSEEKEGQSNFNSMFDNEDEIFL